MIECVAHISVKLFSCCRYGGGPTLARKVINSGLSQMELAIEVYPLHLELLLTPKGDRSTIRISKKVSHYIILIEFVCYKILLRALPSSESKSKQIKENSSAVTLINLSCSMIFAGNH